MEGFTEAEAEHDRRLIEGLKGFLPDALIGGYVRVFLGDGPEDALKLEIEHARHQVVLSWINTLYEATVQQGNPPGMALGKGSLFPVSTGAEWDKYFREAEDSLLASIALNENQLTIVRDLFWSRLASRALRQEIQLPLGMRLVLVDGSLVVLTHDNKH